MRVHSGETYKSTEVKPNCGEITRQHSEEVKTVAKSVYIPAKCLLSVSISYLCFEHRNLVETHISPFPNLYVFMMSNISFTEGRIEACK